MKKSYLFGMFALAAMTMVGCSSDEVVNEVAAEKAVEFGTYVGRNASSRATVIDVEELAEDGFGVFGYYHQNSTYSDESTANFMYNEKVTSSDQGANWTYDPLKYWPNNENDLLSFLAYAPYDPDYELADGTNSTIEFTVQDEVKKQVDLLYLCPQANNEKNTTGVCTSTTSHKTIDLKKPGIDEKVLFHFVHALSRITFKAEVMVDNANEDATGNADVWNGSLGDLDPSTTIQINEVELIGGFYESAKLNLKTGEWSECATGNNSYILEKSTNLVNTLFDGNADVDDPVNDESDVAQREITKTDDSYIMIIPQKFSGFNANDEKTKGKGIKIRVNYTVTTKDSNLKGDKEIAIVNDIISDEFNFTFEQGKAYSFNLHIGMTSVKLSATVEGWNKDKQTTGTVVNVPLNK